MPASIFQPNNSVVVVVYLLKVQYVYATVGLKVTERDDLANKMHYKY